MRTGRSDDNLYSIDELISIYERHHGAGTIKSIGIIPPLEAANAATDEDSDFSDNEVVGNLDHLPARILRSHAQVQLEQPEEDIRDSIDGSDLPSTSRRPRKMLKKSNTKEKLWSPNIKNTWILPDIQTAYGPLTIDFLKNTINCPLEAFRCFFTGELLLYIISQTNLYAGQKGNHNMNLTVDEMKIFIGILLLSGYHSLPSKRMYWQEDPDCKLEIVTNSMRRRRLEEILCYVHLNDNTKINDDPMYKDSACCSGTAEEPALNPLTLAIFWRREIDNVRIDACRFRDGVV
ncbi:Transposase IS4 [Popillia japonica]|uniref:Transposase IS4 n=1 Tax=Popillia japonica TaxID=7064 RepID=A0AAW1LFZ7_POPJA